MVITCVGFVKGTAMSEVACCFRCNKSSVPLNRVWVPTVLGYKYPYEGLTRDYIRFDWWDGCTGGENDAQFRESEDSA